MSHPSGPLPTPSPDLSLEISHRPIWKRLAKWGGFVALGLIYFPLLWLVLLSISQNPLGGIPGPFSLEHYRALFANPDWRQPMLASLAIGAIIGLICAVTATIVGRALPTLTSPGRVLFLFVIPLFVPGMSMGAALLIFVRAVLDLKLGFWSIALGHFVWAFPFALLIILVVTIRFDHRLVEARARSGCQQLARLLGHRVSDPDAGHRQRGAVRVPDVLQRGDADDLPACHVRDNAGLELGSGGSPAKPGADHLFSLPLSCSCSPCAFVRRVLAAFRQAGPDVRRVIFRVRSTCAGGRQARQQAARPASGHARSI